MQGLDHCLPTFVELLNGEAPVVASSSVTEAEVPVVVLNFCHDYGERQLRVNSYAFYWIVEIADRVACVVVDINPCPHLDVFVATLNEDRCALDIKVASSRSSTKTPTCLDRFQHGCDRY